MSSNWWNSALSLDTRGSALKIMPRRAIDVDHDAVMRTKVNGRQLVDVAD